MTFSNPEQIDWSTWGSHAADWHITEMHIHDAWADGITGQGIVWGTSGSGSLSCSRCKAVIPTPENVGVDIVSTALSSNAWRNTVECPSGGTCDADKDSVDDDSNGWPDDMFGTVMNQDFYNGADPNTWEATGRNDLVDCNPGGVSNCATAFMLEGGHDFRVVGVGALRSSGDSAGFVGIAPDLQVAIFNWDQTDEADDDRMPDDGATYALAKGFKVLSAVGSGGGGDGCAMGLDTTGGHASCAAYPASMTNAFDNDPNAIDLWMPTPADDSADIDFWPGCQPNQLSYLPINSDRWGTDTDTQNRSHWPAQNWTTNCSQGVAWGNWTLHSRVDVSIITNRSNATAATTSWSFGTAAGILALAEEAFPNYTHAQILQRLCRTADKIDRRVDATLAAAVPTAYDQPWPKGQILFPGASWNVNMWNNLYGCGRVNMLRFLEEPLVDGPAPMEYRGP